MGEPTKLSQRVRQIAFKQDFETGFHFGTPASDIHRQWADTLHEAAEFIRQKEDPSNE